MIMTNWRHVVLAGWILLFLGGCNLPAPVAENQVEQPQASTLTAKAVDALVLTQLAPTAIQVSTATVQTLETAIISPTAQATPTTPTPTLNPEIEFCTDKATFVEDVSVADGTNFSPGASFTKTWRLKNVGTCAWTPQYKLSFQGGDQLGGK